MTQSNKPKDKTRFSSKISHRENQKNHENREENMCMQVLSTFSCSSSSNLASFDPLECEHQQRIIFHSTIHKLTMSYNHLCMVNGSVSTSCMFNCSLSICVFGCYVSTCGLLNYNMNTCGVLTKVYQYLELIFQVWLHTTTKFKV